MYPVWNSRRESGVATPFILRERKRRAPLRRAIVCRETRAGAHLATSESRNKSFATVVDAHYLSACSRILNQSTDGADTKLFLIPKPINTHRGKYNFSKALKVNFKLNSLLLIFFFYIYNIQALHFCYKLVFCKEKEILKAIKVNSKLDYFFFCWRFTSFKLQLLLYLR